MATNGYIPPDPLDRVRAESRTGSMETAWGSVPMGGPWRVSRLGNGWAVGPDDFKGGFAQPWAVFRGTNAEARARDYAGWLNTGETPARPGGADVLREAQEELLTAYRVLARLSGRLNEVHDRIADALMSADTDGGDGG